LSYASPASARPWRRRTACLATALAAVLAVAALGAAGANAARRAYVADLGDDSVTVIDTATNQVVGAPIPVGDGPFAIAVSPDGTRAYAANLLGESVTVIDTATAQPLTSIPVGKEPDAIATSPDGSRAYVALRDFTNGAAPDVVKAIDTATNQVVGAPITVGETPRALLVSPGGTTLYAANAESDDVSAIDLLTGLPLKTIPVGEGPGGLAISPDGSRLYVATQTGHSVTVVDTATNEPVGAAIPFGTNLNGIVVSPQGGTAYIGQSLKERVAVLDLTTNAISGEPIALGRVADELAITPDGRTVYAPAYFGSDEVTPIDTATRTPGAPIAVGKEPAGVAVSPDQAPRAAFDIGAGVAGAATRFDASATRTDDGGPATYSWNFGDGATARTGSVAVEHTYANPGTYLATLTVTDDQGCSTTVVSTGATVSCNGSIAAAAKSANVTVARPAATRTVTGTPNRFKLLGVKRHPGKGTATLRLRVPAAGVASLRGKQVKRSRKTATGAGVVALAVRAKGSAAERLKRRGTVRVKLAVSFVPRGGAGSTRMKKVRLRLSP
jgi:YVTN family beta-propeller protein